MACDRYSVKPSTMKNPRVILGKSFSPNWMKKTSPQKKVTNSGNSKAIFVIMSTLQLFR
jgi:hypothetical protein